MERRDVRAEWVINPAARRRARAWCTALGIWGIVSGYACFLLWWEHTHDPGKLAWAFAFSLFAALVIEAARDLIHHGELQELRNPSAARVLAVLLTAAMFELFVLAFHGLSELNEVHRAKLREDLLGPVLMGQVTVLRDLFTLAGLWAVVGGAVAWVVASVVFALRWRRVWPTALGSALGALAGVIAAPVAVFVAVLFVRTGLAFLLLVQKPDEWRAHLLALAPVTAHSGGFGDAIFSLAIGAVGFLSTLAKLGFVGGIVFVLLVGLLVLAGVRWSEWRPLALVIFGTVAAVVAPLADAPGTVFRLGLLAVAVWFLPGALMGLSAPLLERPSEKPTIWIWAGLGFAAALLLASLTYVKSYSPVFLAIAALLAVGGVAFFRGARIEEYWPLAALSLAVLVWALALSFKGQVLAPTTYAVLDYLHQVNTLPASVVTTAPVSDPGGVDIILRRLQPPQGEEKSPTLSEKLKGLEGLTPQAQVTTLEAQRVRLDPLRAERYERIRTLVSGEVGRAGSKSATPRPATPDELRAACRNGIDLACPEQIQPDRWDSLAPAIDAEIHDAIRRMGEVVNPLETQAMSIYAADLGQTKRELGHLERANRELLEAIQTRHEKARRAETEAKAQEDWAKGTYAPQQLELSIAGAFAFWVTVGLLVAWSIRRNDQTAVDTDGIRRCFWAVAPGSVSQEARHCEALRRYHDHEHGEPPRSDREMLERLAVEMLLGNGGWEARDRLRQRLAALPPDELAAMSPDGVRQLVPNEAVADGPAITAAIEAVIANARWLQALYREKSPGSPIGVSRLVLDDWRARAQERGAELLDHVRAMARIPAGMPLGTILVSLGLGGEAHFEGCIRGRRLEHPAE